MTANRLFDSNVLIEILRGNTVMAERVWSMNIKNRYISEITAIELLYGAYVSKNVERELEKTRYVLEQFKKLPLIGAEEIFARQMVNLRRKGTPLENFDLMIAATALANDMVLVTGNVKHFGRVEGLDMENWIE